MVIPILLFTLRCELSGENLVPEPESKGEKAGEHGLSFTNGPSKLQMSQVKKRDDLIHKENKLEVGGIPVHPGHMAAMQGEEKVRKK